MFYLVLFCKFLITNGCGTVFGRQGPEVHKIAGSDFGPQSDPQGGGQDARHQIFSPRPVSRFSDRFAALFEPRRKIAFREFIGSQRIHHLSGVYLGRN